jgi:hypothetical protein
MYNNQQSFMQKLTGAGGGDRQGLNKHFHQREVSQQTSDEGFRHIPNMKNTEATLPSTAPLPDD